MFNGWSHSWEIAPVWCNCGGDTGGRKVPARAYIAVGTVCRGGDNIHVVVGGAGRQGIAFEHLGGAAVDGDTQFSGGRGAFMSTLCSRESVCVAWWLVACLV